MKAQHHYDSFPKYIYSTAFDSLQTDHDSVNQTVGIDDKQYSQNIFEKILYQMDDHLISSTQICNNSAWNNDQISHQQSLQDVIQILIDFLSEFLLFLSSIIECKQFYSQFQLQQMVNIAERIHQLRLTLLIQINNTNEPILNIPSISLILHELASCIHCLSKEQQQIESIIEHPHIIMFTQVLDRLEKALKSCMNCINMNNNPQNLQTSTPMMFPCLNFPHTINNPTLSNGCWFPCNESSVCIPWSLLEQIKTSNEKKHVSGRMSDMKDENIRRKLGYDLGQHKPSRRSKQASRRISKQKYKRNDLSNEESNFDSNREWSASSTDEQMLVVPKASSASTKGKIKSFEQIGTKEKSERLSTNSRIFQKKNSANRLGSNRTLSRQQSVTNSKQSSPLLRSNFDTNEPIKLRSTQKVSGTGGYMPTHAASSQTKDLPIVSMLDHSDSQRTSSRRSQRQQSNIYKDDDNKSARSLSFQTSEYRTPSKTTIKMSRDSSPSLSPIHSKSINTQQSNGSIQSRKVSSINDLIGKKSTSSIARSDDKRSFKESINQDPISSRMHSDNIDSPVTLPSRDKIKHNDSISNKNSEQRLASPLSITSAQRMNSTQLKPNSRSPISSKQLSLNKTTSDFNYDNYSEHQMSPSTSFLIETNDNNSLLNVIEEPQSAEGEEITINPSDNNSKKDLSTPHFSAGNTYRQQSTSATSDSNDLSLFPKSNKHSSRSMTRKKRKFYIQETMSIPLQSNKQGYFDKLMKCFRRTTVNRIDQLKY